MHCNQWKQPLHEWQHTILLCYLTSTASTSTSVITITCHCHSYQTHMSSCWFCWYIFICFCTILSHYPRTYVHNHVPAVLRLQTFINTLTFVCGWSMSIADLYPHTHTFVCGCYYYLSLSQLSKQTCPRVGSVGTFSFSFAQFFLAIHTHTQPSTCCTEFAELYPPTHCCLWMVHDATHT